MRRTCKSTREQKHRQSRAELMEALCAEHLLLISVWIFVFAGRFVLVHLLRDKPLRGVCMEPRDAMV